MVKGFSKEGLLTLTVEGDRGTVYAEMLHMLIEFLREISPNEREFKLNKAVFVDLIACIDYESEE